MNIKWTFVWLCAVLFITINEAKKTEKKENQEAQTIKHSHHQKIKSDQVISKHEKEIKKKQDEEKQINAKESEFNRKNDDAKLTCKKQKRETTDSKFKGKEASLDKKKAAATSSKYEKRSKESKNTKNKEIKKDKKETRYPADLASDQTQESEALSIDSEAKSVKSKENEKRPNREAAESNSEKFDGNTEVGLTEKKKDQLEAKQSAIVEPKKVSPKNELGGAIENEEGRE